MDQLSALCEIGSGDREIVHREFGNCSCGIKSILLTPLIYQQYFSIYNSKKVFFFPVGEYLKNRRGRSEANRSGGFLRGSAAVRGLAAQEDRGERSGRSRNSAILGRATAYKMQLLYIRWKLYFELSSVESGTDWVSDAFPFCGNGNWIDQNRHLVGVSS